MSLWEVNTDADFVDHFKTKAEISSLPKDKDSLGVGCVESSGTKGLIGLALAQAMLATCERL
ncbi:hypothetical protein GBA52_014892 [Prunus armeniaca]|nr:hypothetical protein GBA52_014892 [Prunus armeniaca]